MDTLCSAPFSVTWNSLLHTVNYLSEWSLSSLFIVRQPLKKNHPVQGGHCCLQGLTYDFRHCFMWLDIWEDLIQYCVSFSHRVCSVSTELHQEACSLDTRQNANEMLPQDDDPQCSLRVFFSGWQPIFLILNLITVIDLIYIICINDLCI